MSIRNIIFVVVMDICDVHPLSTEREKEGGEVLGGGGVQIRSGLFGLPD